MRILVVDDEPAIRFSLVELLQAEGYDTRAVEHAPAALTALEAEGTDLVISDLSMPAMDGLELLEAVRERHAETVFVLMTAHGDERMAVRALKAGAWDYLPKPFDNEEVRAMVRRAHEALALRTENARLREQLSDGLGPMIGSAPAMREVYRVIRRAGPTDATVLITGESGTGKELAARAIHEHGPRSRREFVALNCSALPGELVESELFGSVRGAFTGADRDREGLFHAASGGTLFLDEIGDLAPAAQAKLLRAIEERAVLRVGATREESVDTRVIAATNQPLDEFAANGRFREDLLFRLAVVTLRLPPLRERREDIIPLAIHFLSTFAHRHGRPSRALTETARHALSAYDWPGNVRELRNALERAVVLAEGEAIDVADLPAALRQSDLPLSASEAALADLPFADARDRALHAFERAFISAALERHGGNVSAAARALGLHRQSLQRIMRRVEL